MLEGNVVDHVRYHHDMVGRAGPDGIPLRSMAEMGDQQARREVRADRNLLFKPRSRQFRWSARTRERAHSLLVALVLTLASILPYVVMIAMWFKSYHASREGTWIVFAVFMVVAIFLASAKPASQKDWPWRWWMGLIFGQATVIGLVVGISAYYRSMRYYWMHDEMRTYTNVAAAQHSDEFIDASMFLFTADTRLDTTRSAGLQSRWSGQTYCVSPIVDSSMNAGDPIYYWAVGVNCCNRRSNFQCDDARDVGTRSGLVVLELGDMADFEQAVSLEKSWYFTSPAERPKFIRWTKDPVLLKDEYYNNARDRVVAVSIAYWAVVFVASYNIASWLVHRPDGQSQGTVFREAGS